MPISFQDRIGLIFREHPELTLVELAAVAGVTKGLVSQWRNGPAKSMSFVAAQQINRKYGYAMNWLMKGDGPVRDEGRNVGESTRVPTPDEERILGLFERLAPSQKERYIREISADVEKNESLLAELRPPLGVRKRREPSDSGEAIAHRVRGGTMKAGSAVRRRRGV